MEGDPIEPPGAAVSQGLKKRGELTAIMMSEAQVRSHVHQEVVDASLRSGTRWGCK